MKKSLLLIATILAALTLTFPAQAKPKAEKAIADDSLLVFDATIPRQYVGATAYKKDWEDFFDMVPGP
ncbi:MAG TPA: hypothetical protein VHZ30_05755, partial [Verrucomicrobiae bacterium]|nr:hypothetical protein [Verrucomicrobiae bacterium]